MHKGQQSIIKSLPPPTGSGQEHNASTPSPADQHVDVAEARSERPHTQDSLITGFDRWSRRWLIFAGAAVVGMAVVVTTHQRDHAWRQSAGRQASVIASMLKTGPGGSMLASLAGVREGHDDIIALATLDASGKLDEMFPDRPSYREAMLMALASHREANHQATGQRNRNGTMKRVVPLRLPSPETGQSLRVAGVIMPMEGGAPVHARQVAMLVRQPDDRGTWLAGVMLMGMATMMLLWHVHRRLSNWLMHEVAEPLQRMVEAAGDTEALPEWISASGAGRWRETARLANRLEATAREQQRGADQHRRFAQQSELQFRTQEASFDRQLRRAMDRAYTDSLTKLHNRTFLEENLERLFDHHRRDEKDFSAVMLDLDNFKQHNDQQGHPVGDALLRFLGALLRGSLRPTDCAVRYGGDEFLLLLPETSTEQARMIAERLIRLFAQYVRRLRKPNNVSMSAGVASITGDVCRSGHDLVAKADVAMYAAKRRGKSSVGVYRRLCEEMGVSLKAAAESAQCVTAPGATAL